LGVILYGHLDIGSVPSCSSMVNSRSRFGSMPGKSFGNTSGNLWETGISLRLKAAM
jgi:hypothetical protein